jgi:hypothetical protein
VQTMIQSIDKAEVLRYLGYHGQKMKPELNALIDQCIQKTIEIIEPKFLYQRFFIQKTAHGISVQNTPIVLRGKDIQNHLENCEEIYLLCATIGFSIEREIRAKMLTSPDVGVILNSCATTAVEQLADLAEQEITAQCASEEKNTTWRFSAGYGDLPLETQKDILTAMDAHRKIGLSLTGSLLLTPTKSITAIIGITDTKKDKRPNKCDYCNHRLNCSFRKRGIQC